MADTIPNGNNDRQAWGSVQLKDKPPQQLGPCKLLRLLGEPGGQGSVWLAEVMQSDGTVESKAVKVFTRVGGKASSTATAAPPEYRRERDIAMQAAHDMQVGDLLTDDHGWWFFFMRAVQGQAITLYCESKRLIWQDRVRIFIVALQRVQAMHAAGVIHRDLKPGNLFVEDGVTGRQACILDFGLATKKTQAKERPVDTTIAGEFAGTPEYAAPELLSGGIGVGDEQSDLHAMGVILHELLTGSPLYTLPADAANTDRVNEAKRFWARDRHPRGSELLKLVARPPRMGSDETQWETLTDDLQAALRRWLDPILLHATHEEPSRRYRRAAELIADLMRVLEAAKTDASADANHVEKFHWHRWSTQVDPWVRQSYIKRIKIHAGLIRGADGLIRMKELSTAAAVLDNADPALANTWETRFLRARAQPWVLNLTGHDGSLADVAYDSGGLRIVTGSVDGTARVWAASTGRELLTLRGHDKPLSSAAISKCGTRILTASGDETAKVWDANTGQDLLTLKGHNWWIYCAAFNPDGTRIATGCIDNTVKVWDASTGREFRTLKEHEGSVSSIAFNHDGTRTVTGSHDNTAKVWDAVTWKVLRTLERHKGWVSSVAFSPDGTRIVTGSYDKTANVWDADSGRKICSLEGHEKSIRCVAFSPDGTRIVTGSEDNTSRIWDAETGQAILTLHGHEDDVWSAAFHPDGTRIVTGSVDRTAKVWDVATGQYRISLCERDVLVPMASFRRSALYGVTTSNDNAVCVWHVSDKQEPHNLLWHDAVVPVARFRWSDTCALGSREGNAAVVWDVTNGQELHVLRGHTGEVICAAFDPTNTRIITGSDDATAKVWDVSTGQDMLTLRGHRGRIIDAGFNPDGNRIVTASVDGSVRVWDASTGQELLCLRELDSVVLRATFSHDGVLIVAKCGDGTVIVWDCRSPQERLEWREREVSARDEAHRVDEAKGFAQTWVHAQRARGQNEAAIRAAAQADPALPPIVKSAIRRHLDGGGSEAPRA